MLCRVTKIGGLPQPAVSACKMAGSSNSLDSSDDDSEEEEEEEHSGIASKCCYYGLWCACAFVPSSAEMLLVWGCWLAIGFVSAYCQMQCIAYIQSDRWRLFQTIFANVGTALAYWAHGRAMWSDPGFVPKPNGKPLLHKGKEGYCEPCGNVKPEGAHHCRRCNRCVQAMDHHCPWTNNCGTRSRWEPCCCNPCIVCFPCR